MGNRFGATVKRSAMVLMAAALCIGGNASATPLNVALQSEGGIATQSSNLPNAGSDGLPQIATRAIDGNTNGNWYTGQITHTTFEFHPWWQVALGGGLSSISEIDIWNRTDCCVQRLDNFDVFVLNAGEVVWSSLHNSYAAAMPEASFYFNTLIAGDTVRIQLETTDYLSLAEVQVWAVPAQASVASEPATLAILGLGLLGLGFSRRKKA